MHYSNCLLEALKAFLLDPKNVRIKKKGSFILVKRKKFPHFYWENLKTGRLYHFKAHYSDEPFLYQLWFLGKISEYTKR